MTSLHNEACINEFIKTIEQDGEGVAERLVEVSEPYLRLIVLSRQVGLMDADLLNTSVAEYITTMTTLFVSGAGIVLDVEGGLDSYGEDCERFADAMEEHVFPHVDKVVKGRIAAISQSNIETARSLREMD